MLKRSGPRLSSFRVPDARGTIRGNCYNRTPVGTELRAINQMFMLQGSGQRLAGAGHPNSRGLIVGGGQHPLPIRTKLSRSDRSIMVERRTQWTPFVRIPNPGCLVQRGRDDPLPIGTEMGRNNFALMFEGLGQENRSMVVDQSRKRSSRSYLVGWTPSQHVGQVSQSSRGVSSREQFPCPLQLKFVQS
jgi:hypothetical protein